MTHSRSNTCSSRCPNGGFLSRFRLFAALVVGLLALTMSPWAVAQSGQSGASKPSSAPAKPGQAKAQAPSTPSQASGQSGQKATQTSPSATGSTQPANKPAATTTTATPAATPTTSTGQQPTTTEQTAATTATTTSSAGGKLDGATYAVRLRDLEQRIDELKEQIRRSHTRLSLLSDTIMGGGGSGAHATLTFENHMSSAFRLVKAVFVLDGAVQFNRVDDSGALAEQKKIPIYRGSVPSGDHTLQVLLEYQGNGYGVFSYLKGYRFEVRSSHSFTITEGRTITLQAIAYEKGGATVAFEQRPALRFQEKMGTLNSASPAARPASPSAPSAAGGKASAGGSVSIGGKK